MSDLSPPSLPQPPALPESRPASPGMIVLGILFMLVWLAVHAGWVMVSLFGTLMANDSGKASGDSYGILLLGVHGGQLLATAAGIFGGMAFFWRSQRKALWTWFAVLFVVGAAVQVGAILVFGAQM